MQSFGITEEGIRTGLRWRIHLPLKGKAKRRRKREQLCNCTIQEVQKIK